MKKLYVPFLALVLLAAAVVVFIPAKNGAVAGDEGPKFSHAVHKTLAECSTCHPAAKSTSSSDVLFPKPEVCGGCHEPKDTRAFWRLDEAAPLDKEYLHARSTHLLFNHQYHVEKLALACESCHADMADGIGKGAARMETCSECHNNFERRIPILQTTALVDSKHAISNRCEICHATLAGLKPKSHNSVSFIQFHGKMAAAGEADRECAVCHSASFCQECHTPSNYVPQGTAKDKFYQDAYPRGEKMDDGALLTVQKVHSLVYRYTHGFEARVQYRRCQTCHTPESFCTPCHQNGYDGDGARIIPQSHQLAGFVTVGAPKAMNRHAKLAEMDMESCAMCHNVDGGDPVCAMCHSSGLIPGGTK